MILQVLKEYGKRTEYRVLEKFVDIEEVTVNNLSEGILLVPGILLGKLDKVEIRYMSEWLSSPNNQLILTPVWKEMTLKDLFNTSIDLKVVKDQMLVYEGIPCQFKIEGKVQERLFSNEQGNFAIHYRKDTGSGLLTVITLPLLDYKQSYKHDEFRVLFFQCIEKTEKKKKLVLEEKYEHEITEVHIQLLMLLAASVTDEKYLKKDFKRYFNKDLPVERIQNLKEDLQQADFIDAEKISDKGKSFIEDKKLKTFIKVLERGRRIDEW